MLMPRETPLSAIHLRNMLTLREAGATILFLAPGFYHGAETVDDLVDFVVARALDQLGLEQRAREAVGAVMVETGTLPAEGVRQMFDRIAPVYDAMNRVMTAGLDRRWRRITIEQTVRAGDRVLDACCGTGDLAIARARARRRRSSGSTSPSGCSSARGARSRRSSGSRATCSRFRSRTRRSTRRPSASACATSTISRPGCASCGACCAPGGRLGILEITMPRGGSRRSIACGSTASCPLLGKVLPGGAAYTYLPASVRRFPRAGGARRAARARRLRARPVPARSPGVSSPCTWGRRGRARALAAIREAAGLEDYLDALEERLARIGREPSRPRRGRRERGARRRRQAAAPAARLPLDARRAASRRSRPASRSSSCTWRRSSTTT